MQHLQFGSELIHATIDNFTTSEPKFPNHGRRPRTRSKELQHEQDPEQGYQAGNVGAEISFSKRISVPVACEALIRKAGYCVSINITVIKYWRTVTLGTTITNFLLSYI